MYCVQNKAQDKGLKFWQTRSHFLYDTVPADCIERVVRTLSEVMLYQRTPTPRPPPKIVSKEARQVHRDDHSQRGSGIGNQSRMRRSSKWVSGFKGVWGCLGCFGRRRELGVLAVLGFWCINGFQGV